MSRKKNEPVPASPGVVAPAAAAGPPAASPSHTMTGGEDMHRPKVLRLGRMYLPAVEERVGTGESARVVHRLAEPIVEMGGRPVPPHGGDYPRYLEIADPVGEGEISPEMARNLELYHGYKRVEEGEPEPLAGIVAVEATREEVRNPDGTTD